MTVSDETLELIEKGLYYSELSGGAFDITIAPVSSLWDFKAENPAVPDSAVLEEAVSHVDYHQVQIDGNQVWLTDPDAGIDLGGIAKGFIADKFKEYLTGQGVTSGIINLGGNVLTIGEKPDGSCLYHRYPRILSGKNGVPSLPWKSGTAPSCPPASMSGISGWMTSCITTS